MRLGGPVRLEQEDPETWVAAHRARGYGAAYCPLTEEAGPDQVAAFRRAAERADLVIAEVGAWSNPLSPDEATRRAALERCRRRLALADEIGARCCVNISGSRGEAWDGPHPDNLTEETFDRIVEMVRSLLDDVRPTRTFYTLETMPWMYPDSVESYERLLRAVDRPRFAVHFDPVNLVCSPQRYYGSAALTRDFCERLGPWIKSCHAKDITLSTRLTVHLDEARPGTGGLDYGVFLREVEALDRDMPVMLEHLPDGDEYRRAAEFVRAAATAAGVTLRE